MDNKSTRRDFLRKSLITGGVTFSFPFLNKNGLLSRNNLKQPIINNINDCFKEHLRKGRKFLHRIITVGDPHWGDDHITIKNPRQGIFANNIHYKDRFDMMISWLNEEKQSESLDYIVFNGDVATNQPEDLPIIKEQFDKLKASYYVVHGNHDHCSEDNWQKLWGYGRNHSLSMGDFAIILLNSANENGDPICADSEWLESQLKIYNNKLGVFIFCHIFQHDDRIIPHVVKCPLVTNLIMKAGNVKMIIYSHKHLMDGYYVIKKEESQLKTFFTGHFSSWGLPYLSYRVIEVYEDNEIGTYLYAPENKLIVNYNLGI
jgi:predicted phosphodiesterase